MTFGVYFSKHSAYDIVFALAVFVPNNCSGFFGDFCNIICGIVIVYVDGCVFEVCFEVVDDFFDCLGFVVTWYEYGDFVFFS